MYNPDWLRYCKRVVRAGLGIDHLLSSELKIKTTRLGSSYGGWIVATEPLRDRTSPIVLSFGLGDDISFDEAVCRNFGAVVYGFDPTPASLECLERKGIPPNMQVIPVGISSFDGVQEFCLPEGEMRGNFSSKAIKGKMTPCRVMRYDTLLDTLSIKQIDILKLDVEGAEYEVIPQILSSSILPRQLLIEFHHRLHGIHVRETRGAVEMVKQAGFSLFAVSPAGQELSFIRHCSTS